MKMWRLLALWAVLFVYGFAWGLSFSPAFSFFEKPLGLEDEVAFAESLPAAHEARGEKIAVTLTIEGRTYTQAVCVPASVRLFAMQRGGFSACFKRLYDYGATTAQILNWAAYPLGDGLISFLSAFETPPVPAKVVLSSSAPKVTPHRDGYLFLPEQVLEAVAACLAGEAPSPLTLQYARAPVTTADLSSQIALVATFSTPYADNPNRVHNLRLACRALNAAEIRAGETFSFNERVGARTEERGYRKAHVIADGAFTDGVGGGVCQVSTTLYNAAMLAGLRQVEVRRHSLAVSYVAPSRDAMVSEWSDLKFANDASSPVYIYANVYDGKVTVKIYGVKSGDVSLKSTSRTVDPYRNVDEAGVPLTCTDGYRLLRAGHDGVEGTLTRLMGGETQLLRRNTYPRQDAVWQIIQENTEE